MYQNAQISMLSTDPFTYEYHKRHTQPDEGVLNFHVEQEKARQKGVLLKWFLFGEEAH